MPKQKTRKSASKRFKVTKTGKVMFEHQMASHLRRKKSARQKRRQAEPGLLVGEFAKKVKRMLVV